MTLNDIFAYIPYLPGNRIATWQRDAECEKDDPVKYPEKWEK